MKTGKEDVKMISKDIALHASTSNHPVFYKTVHVRFTSWLQDEYKLADTSAIGWIIHADGNTFKLMILYSILIWYPLQFLVFFVFFCEVCYLF